MRILPFLLGFGLLAAVGAQAQLLDEELIDLEPEAPEQDCLVRSDATAVPLAGKAYLKTTVYTPLTYSQVVVWHETNGWPGLQVAPTFCSWDEAPVPADTAGLGYRGRSIAL